MSLTWSHSIANLDWEELSALFEACAPMGNKRAADLRTAFGNSMFRCFVRDDGKLVGVGRALADGVYAACTAMAIFENQDAAMERGYVDAA